jgi:hypothetical protein
LSTLISSSVARTFADASSARIPTGPAIRSWTGPGGTAPINAG